MCARFGEVVSQNQQTPKKSLGALYLSLVSLWLLFICLHCGKNPAQSIKHNNQQHTSMSKPMYTHHSCGFCTKMESHHRLLKLLFSLCNILSVLINIHWWLEADTIPETIHLKNVSIDKILFFRVVDHTHSHQSCFLRYLLSTVVLF